jgi:hypothetical protein
LTVAMMAAPTAIALANFLEFTLRNTLRLDALAL